MSAQPMAARCRPTNVIRVGSGTENRQTPSTKCPVCTGTDGKPKETYRNESEAQRRADILRKEQGAELRVYSCEKGHGWHLTKGYSGKFSNKKSRR